MTQKSLIDYKDSILASFKCQKSGNCCTCSGTVYVTQTDKQSMASELKILISEFNQNYIQRHNGWEAVSTPRFRPRCFLDKTNKCSVYAARPKSCKTYPRWDFIWESDYTLLEEASQCPGLKLAIKGVKETINNGLRQLKSVNR
jgi:uncharacterized protein